MKRLGNTNKKGPDSEGDDISTNSDADGVYQSCYYFVHVTFETAYSETRIHRIFRFKIYLVHQHHCHHASGRADRFHTRLMCKGFPVCQIARKGISFEMQHRKGL